MAKSSSKSKGFCKTTQKKPYLTKKEIILGCTVIAVIVLALVLINAYTNMGTISAGKVKPHDIVSYASSNTTSRYFKVGEYNEMDGYTTSLQNIEGKINHVYYYPENEDETDLSLFYLNAINAEAGYMAESLYAKIADYCLPVQETTIQGHNAYVLAYHDEYYEATLAPNDPEKKENVFTQNITAYIHIDDEHTLALHVYLMPDSTEGYIDEADLVEYIQPYTKAFTAA